MLWKQEKWFVPWFVVCASVYLIHSSNVAASLNILEELADEPFSIGLNWMELLMSPQADSG